MRAISALCLLYALTGLAPTPAQADAPGAITVSIERHHLSFGGLALAQGRVPGDQPGRPVLLEFRAPGRDWRVIARSRTALGGGYLLMSRLTSSGRLRVTTRASTPTGGVAAAASGARAHSEAIPVSVGAALSARRRGLDVLAGHRAIVSGVLRPRRAGRRVALQLLRHGRWTTVARARTRHGGGYRLRYAPHRTGTQRVRVRFAGDRLNAPARRRAGRLRVYRLARASWYGPGLYGNHLSCGGVLTPGTIGVANKSLPCGTRLTLHHGGRTLTVRVIDRGPYCAGREFDLTAATSARLHFHGVGAVWTTR